MDEENVTKVTKQEGFKAKSFEESQGRFARDPAAASAAGKVGGVKGGETRRRRGALRRAAQALLEISPDRLPGAEDLAEALRLAGIEGATMADALTLAQMMKAARGDTEAYRAIRDTSGERPADQLHVIPGEVIDADSVAELSDEELAQLAAEQAAPALPEAADVAQGVAPGEAAGPKLI